MNGALDHSDQPDPDAIKMFVGQIPRSWSEKELKELFEPYGAVYQINVLRDRSQNPPQSKGTVVVLCLLSGFFFFFSMVSLCFRIYREVCIWAVLKHTVSSYAAVLRGENSWIPIDYCLPLLLKLRFKYLLSGSEHSNCAKNNKRLPSLFKLLLPRDMETWTVTFPGLVHEKYNFLLPFVSSLCTPGGNNFQDTEGEKG